jgi:hypothetical protein
MVRSGGGIEWLILIYIYLLYKIYVTLYNLKCIANLLEFCETLHSCSTLPADVHE